MSIRLSGLRAFSLFSLLLLILSACTDGDEMLLPTQARKYMLDRLKDESFPSAREAYLALDSLQITSSTTPQEVYGLINGCVFQIYHSGHSPVALAVDTGILELLEKSNRRTNSDDREILNLYLRIGASFSESGLYTVGLAYYTKGLEFCQNNPGFEAFESRFYNNIGILYAEAEMYDKALEYFQKSLEINVNIDSRLEAFLNYVNFTEVYIQHNNLSAAKESIKKGMEYLGAGHEEVSLAQMRIQEGDIDMRQKMYDNAVKEYSEALKLFEKEKYTSGEIDVYLHFGKLYLEMNRTDSAKECAKQAMHLSELAEQGESTKDAYIILSQAYSEEGNYQKSVNALNRAISIQDSLIVAEHRLRLEDWEIVGDQAFPQAGAPTPTESNASLYMIIAFILLAGMIALTYFNLHRRTPAPIDAHKAGEDDFLKERLTRSDRELQSIINQKREHTDELDALTAELRTVVTNTDLTEEERRRRLREILSELDRVRAFLREDLP